MLVDTRDHSHDLEIALFYDVSQAFYSTLEIGPLMQTIIERLIVLIGAEGGSIWMLSETMDELTCTFVAGPSADQLRGMSLRPGEGLAGWVTQTQTPVVIDDARSDPRWAARFDDHLRLTTRNLISVPLVARGQSLGALNLVNKIGSSAFHPHDLHTLTAMAGIAALAIHNAQYVEKERRQREQQALLEHVSQLLHETLDLERLLQQIFEQVIVLLNAEAASVWLVDEKQGRVVCRVATGVAADQLQMMSVPLGEGIVGRVAASARTMLIADALHDARVYRKIDQLTNFTTRSLLTVPLLRQSRCIGAIQVVNKRDTRGSFTPFDQEVLESLADSAALAIENAQLYNDLEQSYESTLEALTAALDLRDKETQGHSRRVVEYTTMLAREVGVTEADMIHIRRGALLHDIGKIGVPDRILLKQGPLDSEERAEMERHAYLGYEMLVGISFLSRAADIVLSHQERWDGRGYPRGLSGEAIPLGARLFAIADTYDAITSNRPYRKGRPYETAAEIITSESGQQFDPRAVAAFRAIPRTGWLAVRELVNQEVETEREAIKALARSILG